MPTYRQQVKKIFVELGWCDGNGIGLWEGSKESVLVYSKEEADAVVKSWLESGKITEKRGYLAPTYDYGLFRIREEWVTEKIW